MEIVAFMQQRMQRVCVVEEGTATCKATTDTRVCVYRPPCHCVEYLFKIFGLWQGRGQAGQKVMVLVACLDRKGPLWRLIGKEAAKEDVEVEDED
eukprot:6045638-Amphidinium_carterae.1